MFSVAASAVGEPSADGALEAVPSAPVSEDSARKLLAEAAESEGKVTVRVVLGNIGSIVTLPVIELSVKFDGACVAETSGAWPNEEGRGEPEMDEIEEPVLFGAMLAAVELELNEEPADRDVTLLEGASEKLSLAGSRVNDDCEPIESTGDSNSSEAVGMVSLGTGAVALMLALGKMP